MKIRTHFTTLALLMLAVAATAQTPTATLVGRITDATGAVVPEANIIVRNVDTNWTRKVSSPLNGEYSVPQLERGSYEITVEKQGFRKMSRTGIVLEASQVARIDVEMQVGAVADSISVMADAPPLNTENGSKGDVVVSQEIHEMPLPGRDFSDLAYLVAGVDRRQDSGQGSSFVINGARGDNTNFLVDGFTSRSVRDANIQMRPSLDALQEFKIQTSGYSAEYGKLAGGVMSMVLKSGGNRLHGVFSEYLRNDVFDARNFFDPDKSKLRQNQFGATLDGPVFIPKVYDGRNKTFFLYSWESYRTTSGDSRRGRVPTAIERAGDFTQTLDSTLTKVVTTIDPLNKVPFPGNKIPVARFSPVTVKLLPYYPAANYADGVYNYRGYVGDDRDAWDSYSAKIDQRISDKDTLSGRYLMRDTRNKSPFDGNDMGTFGSRQQTRSTLVGLRYTHMFSPSVINEFRAGLSRSSTISESIFAGKNWAQELGIPGISPDASTAGFPRFNIGSLLLSLGPSNGLPKANVVNNYEYADSVTWVKSKHLIKFGGDVLRTQFFQPFNGKINGNFDFKGNYAGDTWGDFLLGLPSGADRLLGSNRGYFFLTSYGFYLQDDYKVRPNLTFNIGLRYEIQKPPVDKYDRLSNFIPELGKLIIADDRNTPDLAKNIADAGLTGLVGLARDYDLPRSLVYTNYKNFAPRFGFAWRPSGHGRAVVRGGYGIYYAGMMLDGVKQDMGEIFPFSLSETYSAKNYPAGFMSLSNPFPSGGKITGDGISNSRAFEYKPKPAYMQSWNLTTEREIGKGSAVEVSYVGSVGRHLSRRYDWNQPWREPQYMKPDGTFPKFVPQLKGINMYGFGTNSSYNAGMVSFRKRFSKGFFYRANYTFSKSIDEASQMSGRSKGGFEGGQNMRNLKADRGRSDWDQGHSFNMLFSYETASTLPRGLRGWQLSGNARAYTGQPFTPRVTGVDGNAGEPTRPDRLANGRLEERTRDRWFDLSSFKQIPKPEYRYGNSGRNILDGPGSYGVNLAVAKRFRIVEKHSLQFRWEMFNATNHTNFRIPETAVNDILGGTINSASGERTMQIALKYQF